MIDCLIPARGGSKGIPKKNIIKINGVPLLAFSIEIAKRSDFVKKVFVSTDCAEIAQVAKKFGAEVPFMRPPNLATDTATDKDVFIHFFNKMDELNYKVSNKVLHLRATSPGRDLQIVNQAIDKYLKSGNFSSLRSAHKTDLVPYKWFKKIGSNFYPLIDNKKISDFQNLPRQSFPSTYIPNGYVDIVEKEQILKYDTFHGNSIQAFITDKCSDIDSFEDLEKSLQDPLILKLSEEIKNSFF